MRGILLIADRSPEPKHDNIIVASQRILASHETVILLPGWRQPLICVSTAIVESRKTKPIVQQAISHG
jgi:hypothetical protein